MAKFDINRVENTFNKLLALKICGDGNAKNEDIDNGKTVAYQMLDGWSFGELDSFYENGIGTNIIDEKYPIIIGYALITRYNLSYDEYVAWCKKQGEEYAYDLLKLAGVEDYEQRAKKENKEKEWRNSAYTVLAELIDSKKKIIEFTEEDTGLSLFGKGIEVGAISEGIKLVLLGIKDAYQYGIVIFENEFEKRCTGFKEAYETIERVLGDARDAQWIRLKSHLKKIDIENELMNKIHNEYINATDFSYIKENLEKAYNNLLEQLGEKAQELVIKDTERKSIQFEGGGFGVKGAVIGMVGAEIANNVYEGIVDTMTKKAVENTREQFTSMADRLFTGEETQKFCKEYIEAASKILRAICLNTLFSDQMETATDVGDILEALEKYIGDLSGDDLRKLACNLIFIYPHLIESYKFVSNYFIGIGYELVAIASYFGLDNEILANSRLIYRTQKCAVFSDVQICKHNDGIIIDSLFYEGWKYKIEIPYISDFINTKFWKYSMHGSIAQDAYMINKNSGIIIRYWGGAEGKETYDKESRMTSAQILNQINGWKNINVKDFSQRVETNKSEESFEHIVRCEMIYNDSHDAFMVMHCDQDAYLNICIGCQDSMEDNVETIEEIMHGIVITKEPCNSKNIFFGCTKTEILDIFRREQETEAEKYFKKHNEELPFAIAFRKNFKLLLDGRIIGNLIINKYDYEIHNQDIIMWLEGQKPAGQYILYASYYVIITDFKILLRDKDGRLIEFMINEVAEILLVSTNVVGDVPRLYIRLIDKGESIIRINEQHLSEYLLVIELINRSLAPLIWNKSALYYSEAQKLLRKNSEKIIFCTKCKKISYVDYKGSVLKDSYFCRNCGNENKEKNFIIENKPYKLFNGNFQKRIAELSSESYFKPEDDIIKKYNLKEYSIDDESSERSRFLEKAKGYVISMEGELDYQSAIIYRTLFKGFIKQYLDNEQTIEDYDYKLTDSSILLQTLLKTNQIGQYVLFGSEKIVITDFYIYLHGYSRDYVYSLKDIVEIIPIRGVSNSNYRGVCIHRTDEKFIIVEDASLSDLSKLLDCINIVLEESLKYRESLKKIRAKRNYYYYTYANEKDEAYVYCPDCKTWTTRSKSGNVCNECKMSVSKGYLKERNSEIDAQKNNFKAIFEEKIEKKIQAEIIEDASNQGLVELGMKLHEAREEKEKTKREEKRKKQEEQRIRHNAYIETNDKERKQLIRKKLEDNPQSGWNELLFSIHFRKRIKVLCHACSSIAKDFKIARYGYNINVNETRKFLEEIGLIHEYIIYYDKNILLTDKAMYICSLKQKYQLTKLQEIACYKNNGDYKVFIQYDNSRIPVKLIEMGNNLDLLLIINVSLETLRDNLYEIKYDKYKQCCYHCGSDSIKGGIVNWFCNDCGTKIPPSKIYINYWNLHSSELKYYREQVASKNLEKFEGSDMLLDERNDFELYKTCMEEGRDGQGLNKMFSSTIFCPYCGEKIERTSKFCNFCGKENKYRKI